MAEPRRLAAAVLAGAVVTLPLALALTDVHLTGVPAGLVVSTGAAALAVSALVLQPVLAVLGRIRPHRALGVVALGLVLVHIGGLATVSVEDTLFAMSPDGPTRARMALFATVALCVVVILGLGRARLPLSSGAWRILHGYFAAVVILLGFGHAVLTDGALDGAGTPLLYALGTAALIGVAAGYAARRRLRLGQREDRVDLDLRAER
jgi:predicted ferric reductase